MKIVHVINDLGIGGAQSVLAELLGGWPDRHDQHWVISLLPRVEWGKSFNAPGVSVEYANLISGSLDLKRPLGILRLLRSIDPDIVQTWLYHSDLIGGVAAKLVTRAPVVWGIHHTIYPAEPMKSGTRSVIRWLSWLSGSVPSRIVCCSRSTLDAHVQAGYSARKMIVIANGVDTERFAPDASAGAEVRAELGLPRSAKLIGMFARYHPLKDHATFLQAAGMLVQRQPDVHFVLVGQGVDASNMELQEQISQSGTADHVHLLGIRPDIARLCAALSLASLSSIGEALPLSLCEAMSCGVPCVATRVGDIPSLIGETGMIVEPRSPSQLADGWLKLLSLPAAEYSRLAGAARDRVIRHYNRTSMIAGYRETYQRVVALA